VARLAVLSVTAFAGLAFAYVSVGPAVVAAPQVKITICHATSSKTNPFVYESPSADGVLSAHAHHPDDIIPPFEVVEPGKTTIYPGKNMGTVYGGGFTGAELLANGCRPPTGAVSVTTVPEAIVEPARTITVPGRTTAETIVETFVIPPTTEMAAETTTVVTVPAQSQATVTLPERTVTLPATTEAVGEESVVRASETVTLPETVETVTAAGASTVVTVTGPDKVVEEGSTTTKRAAVPDSAPPEVTTERAQTVDILEHKPKGETVVEVVPRTLTLPAKRIIVPGTRTTETIIERLTEPAPTEIATETSTVVTVEGAASASKQAVVTVTTPNRLIHEHARLAQVEETEVIVVVIHLTHCPPGTALFDGACHHIAAGKG
jgi:hypothetical protein